MNKQSHVRFLFRFFSAVPELFPFWRMMREIITSEKLTEVIYTLILTERNNLLKNKLKNIEYKMFLILDMSETNWVMEQMKLS